MTRTLLPLLVLATLTVPALAQRTPRHRPELTPPVPRVEREHPAQTPPTPAPPQPGICCCRVWSHGWQYSWRPNAECTAQNGSCVSPDHC